MDQLVGGGVADAKGQEGIAAEAFFGQAEQLIQFGIAESFHWSSIDLFERGGCDCDAEG